VRRTGSWGILADCAIREVAQRSKRLWIAVLHQAIEDAKGNTRSAEKSASTVEGEQRDALIWIFMTNPRPAIPSTQSATSSISTPIRHANVFAAYPRFGAACTEPRLDVGQGEG
jgi:hypothetical protein